MGVPYAVALGLIVAILDLIPLAGATIAAILIGAVAFLHSIPAGIVVIVFFIVYQQIENHLLQPRRLRAHGAALAARGADLDPDRRRARRNPRRAGRDPGRGLDPGRLVLDWLQHRRRARGHQRSDPSFGGLPPAGGGPIASACAGTQGRSRCWPRCSSSAVAPSLRLAPRPRAARRRPRSCRSRCSARSTPSAPSHGLAPLRLSPALTAAADGHSAQMARLGYFSHNSANGTSFSQRIARFYPAARLPQLVGRREPGLGRSRHRRRARVPALARQPAAPREPARRRAGARSASRAVHSTSAPGVVRRRPGDGRHRRLRLRTRNPQHPRYPVAPGACSSVEEQRPSKPSVGGSNPPRRIALREPKPAPPSGFRRFLTLARRTARSRQVGRRKRSWSRAIGSCGKEASALSPMRWAANTPLSTAREEVWHDHDSS